MLDSARLGCSRLLLPGFKLAIAFFVLEGSIAGCRADAEPVGTSSSSLSLGDIGGAIVPNGVFTNVYVYPNPATTTWEQHVAARGASAAQFSRASIDAATDRMMAEVWPSYFSPLFQYACGVDDPSCGINPPQFFGSGVASQACVDAALQMAQNNNGVLGLDTIRYLANCHAAGMAPSPQLNLIFSPDIPVAKLSYPDTSGPEMCATSKERGWHSWNVNIPNFSVVPTSTTCFKTFANFTQILSHEIVEVLTDPGGLGFGDFPTYTQEAADLCQNIDPLTIVRGDTLARYWSNTDNNCQPRLDPLPGTKATTEVLTPPTGILMGDVYNPNAKAYPASNPTASLPALAMAPTSAAPANLVVQQVLVVIQTGIGTESSSFLTVTDVDVSLEWKGGNPVPTNILAEAPFLFLAGQTHSAQLNLPGPAIHAGDITGITITLHLPPHPAPARTWEIEKVALVISTVAGFTTLPVQPTIRTRMDRSALPLVRFSGLVHDWQGYTDFLPAEARQVPVQELDLIISTGGDELRGGPSPGDNCDVTLVYDNQSPVTLPNVNQGQTWDGWTKHTVKLPAPNAGHLHAVSLHTGFVSSCCNDNWNVERVQVVAMTDPKYDAMLVDSDHDGIVDGADNCPNIANSLQEDTNYLAEYVTEQRAGCTDFEKTCPTLDQVPSVTQPPPGDLAKFIDAFHKVFPGDACDPVVSTQGGQDGVPFKSGLQGPCQQVFIPGGQNTKPAPTSCEEQENTQLSFQSWTGNSLGSAAPVTGQTLPSFCACGPTNDSPDQQVLNCVVSTSQGGSPCIVADDRSLPGGPVSSGWQPMQQRIFPPKTPAYTMALTQFGSTFQERIFGHPDDSVTSNWDFVADLALYGQAGATHLDGVLWSHVEPYSTMPVCPDRTSGTSCLFTDLNNHYIATTGLLSAGVWFVGTPGPSLVFHIGSWFEVGPGDPMWLPWLALPQSTSGMQVLSLVGTQPSLVTSSFSASALTLLAGVAAGTSDLLVGDDVATGIRHATTPLAAVVVVHGTTAVQGALRVGAGLPQGISVSPIGVVDPPDLRAYAAYDATLYSLHVAQNGASLTALDVQAALGSIQSSTTMSLYGVVPVNPTALVWDRFNRTLYAMDQVPDGQGHSFLRLLNVDVTTGQSFLLWQTTPTNNLPTSTFLSVDQGGHLVLAMVGVNAQSKSEISVLGDAGQPLDSGDFDGNLVLPALAVPAGINVAFADHSTLPVRADFLPWADLESGICSAEWLRVHANTKASPPDALASAALTCNNKK